MPTREDVTFTSAGVACAAWLHRPDAPEGGADPSPPPVVVLAHGLGAVRDMRLDAYAERFSAAGYACLTFDYRHFGSSGGEPRQLLDVAAQLADWRAALTWVRAQDDLDGARVVVWGTSFGGGHAIVTAADDAGVVAAIAQCPFTDGLASLRAVAPATTARLAAAGLRDELAARRGGGAGGVVYVPTAGPPGSVAMMTAPDAEPGYLGLVTPEMPFENRLAARLALRIGLHRPGARLRDVRCPVLLCVCERDSVAPAAATLRWARRAPTAEVRTYDEGHFDIYAGPAFERVVADQLAFLARHVPAG